MDFDAIIEILIQERDSRLIAARINRERGRTVAEEKALQEVNHVRYAIKLFARKKREQIHMDSQAGVGL
jgi:hypothetical protein